MTNSNCFHRCGVAAAVALIGALVLLPIPGFAIDLATLVKKVSKVPDNVEVKHLDEIAQQVSTARAGRELLQKTGGRLDDATERARLLRAAIRETVGDLDPSVLRALDEMDEASQQAALVLSRGARNLQEGIPDVAFRSRFLQDGGGETLCMLGRHDDLLEDAIRFDTALKAGKILPPAGGRPIELSDFGRFFYEQGDRAHHFWITQVRPHWKLWMGGTALAAVMLAPDEYLDAAGDLTEVGLRKIGVFGGELLAKALRGTIEGMGEGAKQATRESTLAFVRTFLTSFWGVLSLAILTMAGLLVIPRTRRILSHRLRSPPASE